MKNVRFRWRKNYYKNNAHVFKIRLNYYYNQTIKILLNISSFNHIAWLNLIYLRFSTFLFDQINLIWTKFDCKLCEFRNIEFETKQLINIINLIDLMFKNISKRMSFALYCVRVTQLQHNIQTHNNDVITSNYKIHLKFFIIVKII